MTSAPQRPIHRLLVANRGEIASRIINAAREHDPPIHVFALASTNDSSHALSLPSKQVLSLPTASDHLNVPLIISLIKEHEIDAVHPGYGFLAESSDFAWQAWDEAKAVVIGPGWDILRRTGDKLAARLLAQECNVPVLSAMQDPTGRVEDVRSFVQRSGLPVMIKSVDGGGGRGIRLVTSEIDLENAVQRAVQESTSHKVFVERAAIDSFRHVEIQIIGDGTGQVAHLWERECSIQRRYQKVIEMAPSLIRGHDSGDQSVAEVIAAATRMAKRVKFLSLGTFEFLVNPNSREFFFLEVNPRLQVEHTVTEQISQADILALQLDIAQGTTLDQVVDPSLNNMLNHPLEQTGVSTPPLHSIQLRLTAENPQQSFTLDIGKISSFAFPSGSGIRVDTNLIAGHDYSVTPDFDSLLAKIIVTGRSWTEAVRKARRALEDTRVDGVKTNVDILRAVVASEDFIFGRCDTQWLETHLGRLLQDGEKISAALSERNFMKPTRASSTAGMTGMSSSTVLLRKGDAWKIAVTPSTGENAQAQDHLLKLNRVLRNEFPSLLNAEVEYTLPGTRRPQVYSIFASAASGSASGASTNSSIRRGDASNPDHIVIPFPGILVEVLVDEGDTVKPGQVICVVKQMKMELEVRAQETQTGAVKWVTEVEEGDDVVEGTLVVELDSTETAIPAKL